MRGLRTDWQKILGNPKVGDLKVWWIPQIPGKSFEVPVKSFSHARFLLDSLAEYDFFQLENCIKPDYSNAGGLMIYESDGVLSRWCDFCDEDGDEFDDLTDEQIEALDDLRGK